MVSSLSLARSLELKSVNLKSMNREPVNDYKKKPQRHAFLKEGTAFVAKINNPYSDVNCMAFLGVSASCREWRVL